MFHSLLFALLGKSVAELFLQRFVHDDPADNEGALGRTVVCDHDLVSLE